MREDEYKDNSYKGAPLPNPMTSKSVFRHKPTLKYCGLTIVLSNPSRFDTQKLLTGHVRFFVEEVLQSCMVTLGQCDIRTANTREEGLLEGTKGVLLCGEFAMRCWGGNQYSAYSLHEQRGYILDQYPSQGVFAIPTYFPQDCLDVEDYEARLNKLRKDYLEEYKTGEGDDKRRHGRTQRQNYRFWFSRDVRKILRLIRGERDNIKITLSSEHRIFPAAEEVISELQAAEGATIYFDIETDSDWNITCFAYAINSGHVSVVPFIRYDYQMAYGLSNQARIYRALAIALSRNRFVIHNANFDLFILAHKYRMPFGRDVFDTMWAHWRCFPRAEKSLGHAISNFCLEETYHKDEGVFEPTTPEQEQALWKYNGKDVSSMRLLHLNMLDYAKRMPGLIDSIEQSNKMIYPYLLNTLMGVRYDRAKLDEVSKKYDHEMTQYLRIIKALAGEEVLPTSPKQMTDYFQYGLGYKAVKRSKTGNASWNEEALYKLKFQHPDNPVIDFMLKFRHAAKERGMLKFEPWKIELKGDKQV